MVSAAKDVAFETVEDTERYRLRRALAINVLGDPDHYAVRFAWLVVANPAIGYTSTDGDIQFTVNSSWDAVAGAPAP